jgi:hypothetical protein
MQAYSYDRPVSAGVSPVRIPERVQSSCKDFIFYYKRRKKVSPAIAPFPESLPRQLEVYSDLGLDLDGLAV